MEEIKHHLVDAYSEEGVTVLLFYFRNMSPMEAMYFLGVLAKRMDRDCAVVVLAYLLHAQSRGISYPKYAQRTLNYHVHVLNKRISKSLPRMFHRFIPAMRLFGFAEPSTRARARTRISPLGFLVDSVFEILVKTSNAEIENSIQTYFHEGAADAMLGPVADAFALLCKMQDGEAVRRSLASVARILETKDVPDVLSFVNEHSGHGETLFLYLYLTNREVYKSVFEAILGDRRYFRQETIRNLAEFDVERVVEKITDESASVLGYIFRERRGCVGKVAEMIRDGRVGVSREVVLTVFRENYGCLREYSTCFGLGVQELLEMCRTSDAVLPAALESVVEQEDLNSFVDVLKEKEDETVIGIIEGAGERRDNLIAAILKRKVVRGQLRRHLLGKYLENTRFVYGLLPYLDKSDAYKYVAEYIVDEESLNVFLKVIECSELLIFAHKMADVARAMKILDLCFRSPRFTESDFLFALTILEKDVPLLIMRTLIQTLLKFPSLRSFVVSFLSRLTRRDVFEQEDIVAGIVKCLEMLGTAAVDIVAGMGEAAMHKVLGRSAVLRKACHEQLQQRDSRHSKSMLASVLSQMHRKV